MSNTVEIRDLRQQNWVWTSKALLFHPDIDGNAFKVYCGLASYADNKTQEAYPSIPRLARELHMGKNTVIRGIQKLALTEFIRVERTIGEHNIYYLLNVPGEHGKRAPKKVKEADPVKNWVKELLEWAETRKGAKFVNYGKQIGALGLMQKSGYEQEDIKRCFEIMEADEFWRSKGFDFTNVANELPKKIVQIRQTSSNGTFSHLTTR